MKLFQKNTFCYMQLSTSMCTKILAFYKLRFDLLPPLSQEMDMSSDYCVFNSSFSFSAESSVKDESSIPSSKCFFVSILICAFECTVDIAVVRAAFVYFGRCIDGDNLMR